MQTAQQRFDALYVSGLEIRKRLKVASCTLTLARQRGDLPPPIVVGGNVFVWERDTVEPYLKAWAQELLRRRNPSFTAAKMSIEVS
jgi:hypothetical protein